VLFLLIALALLVWSLYGDWKRSSSVDDTIE
jgi:hypothetical protein